MFIHKRHDFEISLSLLWNSKEPLRAFFSFVDCPGTHTACLQEEAAPEKGVVYSTEVEADEQTATVEVAVLENYVKTPSVPHLPDPIPALSLIHISEPTRPY